MEDETTQAHCAGFQGYNTATTGTEDTELTHVVKGSPCGEYLRRYWQPVAMASEIADLPVKVRVLGEDLVLFKDKSGQYGLLHRHCAHRGASLEYGIVAQRGIICCYHGWHYDVDGRLLKAGSEPLSSPVCKNVVQGAYPVQEQFGVLFAYLGPMELKPQLPVFDNQVQDNVDAVPFSITTPCNWLQIYENTQDPIHVLHLHARSSGVQFGVASGVDQVIEYQDTPLGMMNIQTRHVGDHAWTRTTDSILPNANQTGAIFEEAEESKYFQRVSMLRWMVPIDNTHTRTIGWRYFDPKLDPRGQEDRTAVGKESIDFIGQTEDERSYEDRQRQPGDYEAQVSQRPIAIHQLEHLASSDTGVARLRRLLRDKIQALKVSGDVTHPVPNASGHIATYCQDTVWPWPSTITEETESRVMKQMGRCVAKAVLASGHLSPAERIQQLQKTCMQIDSSVQAKKLT